MAEGLGDLGPTQGHPSGRMAGGLGDAAAPEIAGRAKRPLGQSNGAVADGPVVLHLRSGRRRPGKVPS